MKYSSSILVLVSILLSNTLFAQLDKDYIKSFKKTPKSFVLNVITEKEKNGTFIYKKHVKYVVEIQDYLMKTQTVFDTVGYKTPYHRKFTYTYNNKLEGNILLLREYDLKNHLLNEISYTWDKGRINILKEEHKDADGTILETITYKLSECLNPELLKNVPLAQNEALKNSFYVCEYSSTKKPNLSFNSVDIYFGGELAKSVKFENNNPSKIASYITYLYNKKWKLSSETKTTSSEHQYKTTYEYDDKGNIVHKKVGFVEFYYTYKYDKFNNWVESVETAKGSSTRTIYKRTINY